MSDGGGKTMKKISVDLDEKVVERISGIAARNFRTFSNQVRLILTNYKESP